MMRILLVWIASAAVFPARGEKGMRTEWEDFKTKYGRNYLRGPEDDFRFKIFAENRRHIAKHNEKFRRGLVSYSLAINRFADMHRDEFTKSHCCGNFSYIDDQAVTYLQPPNLDMRKLPKTVDWRKKGYVTPVKDQGHCCACWTFGATGSLEGQHFRKTGKLVSLSEQNLLDCVKTDGVGSDCYESNPWSAFIYIRDNGGIDTEESYPYVERRQQCRFKRAAVGANVTGYVRLQEGSEEQLQIAVATVGPVSVFINPHFGSLSLYADGIVDNPECPTTDARFLNHVVLVVGYGVKHGKKYWLIKNSWGTGWGDKGYAKIARDKNNMCGIAAYPTYPLV